MTVASTTARKSYTGDAVTTSFATSPLVFFDDADLDVYVVVTATGVSETLVLDTDYTVTGGDGTTGTVDLSGGSSPYGAPAATQTLVIVRDVALTQSSDFINNDTSDAEVVEDAFDRLTMIAQQNAAAVDRAFTLADSDVSGASTVLPTPAASKLIGWDSAGTALANYASASVVDTIVPTAFMETLLDDADAATARTTLGVVIGTDVSAATPPDDVFKIVGSADATKKLRFETDGFTTGNTRVVTFPDADLTLPAVTAAGDIVQASGSGVLARLAIGTARQVLTVNAGATAPAWQNPITLAAMQTAAGNTVFDFGSIPAGVRRITISMRGLSLSGTDNMLVQIGTAATPATSGYVSTSNGTNQSGGSAGSNSTAGFLVYAAVAADVVSVIMTLTLIDSATNAWVSAHSGKKSTDTVLSGGGDTALAGVLDIVRVTRTGSDTFDAGTVAISYE